MSIEFDYKSAWPYLRSKIVPFAGELAALDSLRAAVQKNIGTCDPDKQTVSYLQYLVVCDVYYDFTRQRAGYEPVREFRFPREPMIQKEILLGLAADSTIGLDALAQAIETNAQEYGLGTQSRALEYRPGTQPQPANVPQSQGARIQQQTTPAPSSVATVPRPPAPAGGLANSRWAPGAAGASSPAAGQSQKTQPAAAPAATLRQMLSNISEAQQVKVLVAQSLQQKSRDAIENNVKRLDKKQDAPPAPGLDAWEIPLPPAVDPLVSIKPYQRLLQDALGVYLLFKGGRLFIGESNYPMNGQPERFRTAEFQRRRVAAWNDMMAYVKYGRDHKVAPDIAQFILSRHLDTLDQMGRESQELINTVPEESITGAEMVAPVAPYGECLKYYREQGRGGRKGSSLEEGFPVVEGFLVEEGFPVEEGFLVEEGFPVEADPPSGMHRTDGRSYIWHNRSACHRT
ncbi:hypothetical protein DL767_009374 [Monosporascus sp. MG133]|nr:hypothetical protein DL767_009374 [Monosporascus sp. MG133]